MTSILKQQLNQQQQQQQQQAAHKATLQQRSPAPASSSPTPVSTARHGGGSAHASSATTGPPGVSRSKEPAKGTFSTRRPSQLQQRQTVPLSSFKGKDAVATYATPDRSVSPNPKPHAQDGLDEEAMSTGEETDDLDMEGVQKRDMAIAAQQRQEQDEGDDATMMEDDAADVTLDASMSGSGLAETWLPQLLSQHGPLAIRHLTQFLAHGNATFGALQPGRQRRVVVRALESRKGVLFEKAGWGRWSLLDGKYDASLTGNNRAVGYFTPESLPMQIRSSQRQQQHHQQQAGSLGGHGLMSASLKRSGSRAPGAGVPVSGSYQSHHEFLFSPSLSVGVPREEDEDVDPLDLDEESGTDEEDWKTLGAEGLRRRAQASRTPSHPAALIASSFTDKSAMPMSPAMMAGSYASPRHGPMQPGSYSGSSPYPIRRKSSAGIYQLHHHHAAHRPIGSPSGSYRPPTFPKSSSFVRNTKISPDRLSSSPHVAGHASRTKPTTIPGQQQDAEAAEALFMLSNSLDERERSGRS
ncbi:putative Sin3 binding protein-domain-containing protein [Protomyces lactucae-debilis]|uniref:Putative Sin3 binding protein-domain-containing protein n=1 Tax=Protomyces lactucae-debilis TaxID=2754530 RepID=A0A1Y2FDN3_PROLT|nr:putative Sin3 binding protein-domain-containing protein [Protomyces lactucae-debilis]ORY82031.1 putative Sin3 binding protein-domain-containing protein [Protomyces lactucae-debilis]